MADLFNLTSPAQRTAGDRMKVRMEEDGPAGPIMLASPDELRAIFEDMVKAKMPPNAETLLAECMGGTRRFRKEVDDLHINELLGKVDEHLFRWGVHNRLDPQNEGSFVHGVTRMQFNGKWAPVGVDLRETTVPRNNRVAASRSGPESVLGAQTASPLDGFGAYTEMVATPVRVLQYVIIWADEENAPDVRYDARGNPITETDVKVTAAVDPNVQALAAGVAELAKTVAAKGEPSPATAQRRAAGKAGAAARWKKPAEPTQE